MSPLDADTQGTLLKAGVAVGAIVIVGAVAYKVIGSVTGPPGGSCSDTSSPCYQALQPLEQEFAACAQQYNTTLAQFIQEDSANGTGITSDQQSVLNQLTACMNTYAKQIATTAQGYGVNGLDTVLAYLGEGGAGLLALVGLGKFVQYYQTSPATGAGAASVLNDATIQDAADAGEITAESASAFSSQLQSTTQDLISADQAALNDYVGAGILTADDAAQIAAADADAFEADAETVVSALEGLAGYSPMSFTYPQNTWGPVPQYPSPPPKEYDANEFGFADGGPFGGVNIVEASPAAEDCGCHGLRFGRGNMWMLKKGR
jgi:hypothetical protein